MAVTLFDHAIAWAAGEDTRRFLASLDDGPWCTCLTLPVTDPCDVCVEQGFLRNARVDTRPPRQTAVMLGVAEPEGPNGDEMCTCMFVPLDTVCPGCATRGFTSNGAAY